MRKLYYVLTGIAMILVTIVACEQASVEIEELQAIEKVELSARPDKQAKVTICHYDVDLGESYQISISVNGLSGHYGDENTPRHEGDEFPVLDENYNVTTPLDDIDNDGIVDCADCNVDPDNLNPEITSEKTMWYRDADGDGFGDPEVYIETCMVRDGYVADNTDCDDADAAINPGAIEVCDGIDNNCDGNIDEGVKTTFYQDLDGDTLGNPAVSVEACDAPEGYVDNSDDCDDNWYAYSPVGTYTIYRANSSFLENVYISYVEEEYIITGDGIHAVTKNKMYYYGKVFFGEENSVRMYIWQYENELTTVQISNLDWSDGDFTGRHEIGGFVYECGGLVGPLSELYEGTDYSFEPFEGVVYPEL